VSTKKHSFHPFCTNVFLIGIEIRQNIVFRHIEQNHVTRNRSQKTQAAGCIHTKSLLTLMTEGRRLNIKNNRQCERSNNQNTDVSVYQ